MLCELSRPVFCNRLRARREKATGAFALASQERPDSAGPGGTRMTDRFGVSWQSVPTRPVLSLDKPDISVLQTAFEAKTQGEVE